MKAEILMHDPSALVTMGFFAPEIAAPDWYVETASLLAGSDLDYFDFHAYSGGPTLLEHADVFGMLGYDSKPIVLGEYGAFRHIYPDLTSAARAITEWQSESCQYGFDGWLYWTYYPANASVNDRTWGFTDEDFYFFDLLAPVNLPDPCTLISIESPNLAYLKATRASRFLGDEPPEQAVDEIGNTSWSSGADAPQWIEIDLGAPASITEIRLLVAQYPEGATVHVIRGRSNSGNFMDLHTFNQVTRDRDWLVFTPETPIDNIQVIRVQTVSSVSWVAWSEIQVFGEWLP
jgi:hypothetical protein